MDILEIMKIPYYKNGSGIHIKEKNRGKFTKSAKEHDMGVLEFANHVLSNKDKYSTTLIKHAKGGLIKKCLEGNFFEKLKNKKNYLKGYAETKLEPKSYIKDLSKENVARITKDNHKKSDSLLWNDFVENNPNSIRQAKEFINTSDNYFGDNNIPLSNISTYYGIENGKLKAGNINTFNPETVVVPNRAKNIGKIKKIISNFESFDYPHSAITTQNDTVPLPINASTSPKMVFANEDGNAVFISNLYNQQVLDSLNTHLNNTPMYPLLVDNGQYANFYPKGESLDTYSGINKPEEMFIIGTKK